MKSAMTIRVPIDSAWDGGTSLQVYTDSGTGTVDTAAPLLPRPMEVFPGQLVSAGYGDHPYGEGAFGTNSPALPRTGGFGEQVYGDGPYGGSEPYVEITVNVPAVFDKWIFAVEVIDGEGNVQTDPPAEIARIVSATEPPTVRSMAFDSYAAETDQVTVRLTANTE